ncbi:alanine racemase [Mycolicibacterium sp.]|uniref:alanine racemase n=1 Tax=Mycolicibacterium sp. TaxID=2320850 RepID=UPI003D107A1A
MNPAALDALLDTQLDSTTKGVPLGTTVALRDVGSRGWNVARGDLALPVTTLRADAVAHNIATMAQYCQRYGALFAPHGKTTMSPQLFWRQLDAGAWAITAATPTQASVMRRFGVPRIIVANEITDAGALRWVAREMAGDDSFDLHFLVDNPESVAWADSVLADQDLRRTVGVFLEVGVSGGRTGVRNSMQAKAVAHAVAESEHLRLIGVESYEGLVTSGARTEDLADIDGHLRTLREVLISLDDAGYFPGSDEIYVSAGGSSYFDRVVAMLGDWSDHPRGVRLILRSGCYLSHDLGKYHALSPLDGRRPADEELSLVNALEAWATVLSVPEPDVAILSSGKRDVAHDLSLPVPLRLHHRDGSVTALDGAQIYKLMDQHSFLRAPGVTIHPGDIVAMGLSHPCTAFDKCRFIPLIDDGARVVDAVLTFF